MVDRVEHWNQIFATKDDPQLGWYEADVRQTLGFLDLIPRGGVATIFLPGAGTSLLVDELMARGAHVVLNDISDTALAKLRSRIGQRANQAIWLHHDISKPFPAEIAKVDLWIDRAVLHFLLAESDIEGYFNNLRAVVKPGGHVLLAEFAETGAPRCAGLEVHRYTSAEMARRLGAEFSLIKAEDFTFVNPAGDQRPYVYALFQRGHDHGAVRGRA